MDIEILKMSIMDYGFNRVLVGLHWKVICWGIQGGVKKDNQVKALHIYIDRIDVAIANHG